MTQHLGFKTLRYTPAQQRRWLMAIKRCSAVAMFAGAMICGAAIHRLAIDVLAWRETDEGARQVAGDPSYPDDERRRAMTVMLRHSMANNREFQKLAELPGYLGENARGALTTIHESSK